jgi:hypothetical protein
VASLKPSCRRFSTVRLCIALSMTRFTMPKLRGLSSPGS